MEITKAEIASAAAAQQHTHSPQELMGSEILVKALQAEGVKYIWGYPGGAVLYIYDALYKQDTMQHVLVRHEQAAVHAADGYARATGDVGVALVTSGPGATNTVTGLTQSVTVDNFDDVVQTASEWLNRTSNSGQSQAKGSQQQMERLRFRPRHALPNERLVLA